MAQILENMAIGQPPAGKPIAKLPQAPGAPTDRTPQAQPGEAAPTNKPSQPQTARSAPTVRDSRPQPQPGAPFEQDAAIEDVDAPPFDLTHARILYASALAGSSVAATNGSGAINVLNPATYSRWTFSGAASIVITLPAAQQVDAIGVAGHSLRAGSVTVETSTNDGDPFGQFAPTQSGPAAMLFLRSAPVTVKRIRVSVNAVGVNVIGVVYAGIALQMQRPIYRGHMPATMSRQTEYLSNESEGGQWLGRNVIRQGLKAQYTWTKLTAAWVRQYFDPFADAARAAPFFIAWNPAEFPREVAYAWTTEDTAPTNTGPRDLMSVTLSAKGAA